MQTDHYAAYIVYEQNKSLTILLESNTSNKRTLSLGFTYKKQPGSFDTK